MTPRERLLTAIVGGLMAILVGYWGYSQIASSFRRRAAQRRQVIEETQRKQQILDRAIRTSQQMSHYESMSLPSNLEIARSQYQGWLSEILTLTEMQDPQVKVIAETRRADGSTILSLSVSGKGDLRQVTQLLAKFYEIHLLHRIRILPLRPVPETKWLDVNMTVDALILASAPENQDLDVTSRSPLADVDMEALTRPILERNFFAAQNRAPFLGVADEHRVEVGKMWTLGLDGSDPDTLDRLTYRLLAGPDTVRLDASSGALVWKPEEEGLFSVKVAVTDDGIPQLSTEKTLTVDVVPPAPEPEMTAEEEAAEREAAKFDDARFTYAIASVDVSGDAQIWLQIRTKGEMQRLRVGDRVSIGSVDGTITKITSRGFEWESDGATRMVTLGDPLVPAR